MFFSTSEALVLPRFRHKTSTAEDEILKESVFILQAAFADINIAKADLHIHIFVVRRAAGPINLSTENWFMRTILFLVAGLFLMTSLLIVAKMFSEHFPSAPNWAIALGLILWLMITATNMWIGVSKAGYSVADELPILLLLFVVPAAAVVLVRWRFL